MDNLQTNLFGVIHVTSSFLPLLKKGKGKQIFGVSSTCGSIGGPFGENQSATACAWSSFPRLIVCVGSLRFGAC